MPRFPWLSQSGLQSKKSRAYFLGLILALTSPWNIGFWLAVIGGQQGPRKGDSTFLDLTRLAAAVVLGRPRMDDRLLGTALKHGARIFARPAWQVGTQAVSALVMLFFAARAGLALTVSAQNLLPGVRAWLGLASVEIDRRCRADTFLSACPNGKRN